MADRSASSGVLTVATDTKPDQCGVISAPVNWVRGNDTNPCGQEILAGRMTSPGDRSESGLGEDSNPRVGTDPAIVVP